MYLSVLVVPVESESDVFTTTPIFRDLVVLLECVCEVEGVGFCTVFDSKIIDNECEDNVSRIVSPQAWIYLALLVPVLF